MGFATRQRDGVTVGPRARGLLQMFRQTPDYEVGQRVNW